MYMSRNTKFPWLTFDHYSYEFDCGKCGARERANEESVTSGSGEEQGKIFTSKHEHPSHEQR